MAAHGLSLLPIVGRRASEAPHHRAYVALPRGPCRASGAAFVGDLERGAGALHATRGIADNQCRGLVARFPLMLMGRGLVAHHLVDEATWGSGRGNDVFVFRGSRPSTRVLASDRTTESVSADTR